MSGAQSQGAFVVLFRNGANLCLTDSDNRRQYHHSQEQGRREQSLSAGAEEIVDRRYDDQDTEETVDDGRDSRHEIDGGFQHAVKPFRAETRHKHSAQQTDGHTDDDGSRCHI